MKEKISYRHLDGWLKTLVVFGWVCAGITALAFLVGFIQGFLLLG